jgi:thiosulfate reductase cytochrome b subunit
MMERCILSAVDAHFSIVSGLKKRLRPVFPPIDKSLNARRTRCKTQEATDSAQRQKCYPACVPDARNLNGPRHAAFVRVTHWITALAFVALLVSGAEIVISHPRFYWGETGNVHTKPLFQIPIPSSRDTVPTGYHYVLPDGNGWGRYLHFQSAWAVVLAGLVYYAASAWTGHFAKDLVPERRDLTGKALAEASSNRGHVSGGEPDSYNVLQKLTYLAVIFVLFPLLIWTGLALSPMFNAAVPAAVNVLGGRQSARTLHFFISGFLLLFVLVHLAMVIRAGFISRVRSMITGALPAVEGPTS